MLLRWANAPISSAAAPGWCLIVVGDAITPDDEYEALAGGFEGVTYLSLAAQRELPFESIPLTPERHFGRKNIGHLYAVWCRRTGGLDCKQYIIDGL